MKETSEAAKYEKLIPLYSASLAKGRGFGIELIAE